MIPPSSQFAVADPEPPSHRRSLAVAIALLVAVMVGAAVTLVVVIRANAGGTKRSTTRATATTTTTLPPSTTTTTAPPASYEVRNGESLSGIARHFGVSVTRLAALNTITDPNRITPHQVLRIPRVRLAVDPVTVTAGRSVAIRLTGAGPGETITFTVNTHTGAPHTASTQGTVDATYRTATTDRLGPYDVTADGGQGTHAQATFTVVAPPAG